MSETYTTTTMISEAKNWIAMACGSISSIYFQFIIGGTSTRWMGPREAYRYIHKLDKGATIQVIKRKYN